MVVCSIFLNFLCCGVIPGWAELVCRLILVYLDISRKRGPSIIISVPDSNELSLYTVLFNLSLFTLDGLQSSFQIQIKLKLFST